MKCWLLLVTSSTSCWNGDCDGDGCNRGLCCTDGDGLGVKNGPGGDKIPETTTCWSSRGWKIIHNLIYDSIYAASFFQRVHLSLLSPRTRRTLLVCFLFLNDGKMSIFFFFSLTHQWGDSLYHFHSFAANFLFYFCGEIKFRAQKSFFSAKFAHASESRSHRYQTQLTFLLFLVNALKFQGNIVMTTSCLSRNCHLFGAKLVHVAELLKIAIKF